MNPAKLKFTHFNLCFGLSEMLWRCLVLAKSHFCLFLPINHYKMCSSRKCAYHNHTRDFSALLAHPLEVLNLFHSLLSIFGTLRTLKLLLPGIFEPFCCKIINFFLNVHNESLLIPIGIMHDNIKCSKFTKKPHTN